MNANQLANERYATLAERQAFVSGYQAGIERAAEMFNRLEKAAAKTLLENLHLADGDCCTLYDLREAVLAINPTALDE